MNFLNLNQAEKSEGKREKVKKCIKKEQVEKGYKKRNCVKKNWQKKKIGKNIAET